MGTHRIIAWRIWNCWVLEHMFVCIILRKRPSTSALDAERSLQERNGRPVANASSAPDHVLSVFILHSDTERYSTGRLGIDAVADAESAGKHKPIESESGDTG